MTTDEIRALIAKKISGQGSAIDVGNGLEPILNALCDAVDAAQAAAPKVLHCGVGFTAQSRDGLTISEIAETLKISEQETTNLLRGVYSEIDFEGFYLTASIRGVDAALYGSVSADDQMGAFFHITGTSSSGYSLVCYEL